MIIKNKQKYILTNKQVEAILEVVYPLTKKKPTEIFMKDIKAFIGVNNKGMVYTFTGNDYIKAMELMSESTPKFIKIADVEEIWNYTIKLAAYRQKNGLTKKDSATMLSLQLKSDAEKVFNQIKGIYTSRIGVFTDSGIFELNISPRQLISYIDKKTDNKELQVKLKNGNVLNMKLYNGLTAPSLPSVHMSYQLGKNPKLLGVNFGNQEEIFFTDNDLGDVYLCDNYSIFGGNNIPYTLPKKDYRMRFMDGSEEIGFIYPEWDWR